MAFADSTSLVSEVMPWSVAADLVEQRVEVGRAVLQRSRSEEVGRIVESRIDLLARGESVLRNAHQVRSILESEQVLPHAGRENDVTHDKTSLIESGCPLVNVTGVIMKR
jgi:hypothetical protein